MKRSLTLLIFLFFSYILNLQAQLVQLPEQWKFITGDKPEFRLKDFDDHSWTQLRLRTQWENQGFNEYNGIAWYRCQFSLPDSLTGKELYLLTGKIDDADETYLNGEKIGQSGDFPPGTLSAWNQQRIYKIPAGLLKSNNTIAIRVYDGTGGGGIYGGSIGLYTKEAYIKELNAGPAPKKSFFYLTTANGMIDAVYDEKRDMVETVYPHLFQSYDFEKPVSPFLRNFKINGLPRPSGVGTVDNTHVIRVSYSNDIKVYYLAPFQPNVKVFAAIVEGSPESLSKVKASYEKEYGTLIFTEKTIKISEKVSRKYFLFSFTDSIHNNNSDFYAFSMEDHLKSLPEAEIRFMKEKLSTAFYPAGLNAKERSLYEQSLTLLKMGQVSQQEVFPLSRGQIIASLRPGNWNIGWLRDGTYAIMALSKAGWYAEAKDALEFFLKANCGYYEHYTWTDGKDHGVGTPYKLSVCRYFGIGKEESDFNDFGPNIELDGFGLFLTAFVDYIRKSGDQQMLDKYRELISSQIADPILTFIEDDNLIRKESGPWEQHLPGRKQAFTSIVNAAGLREYAQLLNDNGFPGGLEYLAASNRLVKGIQDNLVVENAYIKGFKEATDPKQTDYFDGGTIEAFTQGLYLDKKFFDSHFKKYSEALRITPERGFSRLNNPDWYTIAEWPFLDMRIVVALYNLGRKAEAMQLMDSITAYASLNFNYIAELYDHEDENYGGAIPMLGYGAGAYILTMGVVK